MSRVRRVFLAGALLAACGCGGGGGDSGQPSEGEWADDVCTSVSAWLEGLKQAGTSVAARSAQADPGDMAGAKADLVAFVSDAVSGTDKVIDEVERAGVPDGEGGEEAAGNLRAGLERTRDGLVKAQDQAAALETGEPLGFARGAQELSTQLQTSLGEVEQPLKADVLQKNAKCRQVTA